MFSRNVLVQPAFRHKSLPAELTTPLLGLDSFFVKAHVVVSITVEVQRTSKRQFVIIFLHERVHVSLENINRNLAVFLVAGVLPGLEEHKKQEKRGKREKVWVWNEEERESGSWGDSAL